MIELDLSTPAKKTSFLCPPMHSCKTTLATCARCSANIALATKQLDQGSLSVSVILVGVAVVVGCVSEHGRWKISHFKEQGASWVPIRRSLTTSQHERPAAVYLLCPNCSTERGSGLLQPIVAQSGHESVVSQHLHFQGGLTACCKRLKSNGRFHT
jgi:hypothetical protein